MSDKEISITIRSIQHYMYCPHRWGLIEIGQIWLENYFVTKANLMHKRVHDPKKRYTTSEKKVLTSVDVFCTINNTIIHGVVDCIELRKVENGTTVLDYPDKYKMDIVEYKPTAPKDKEYHYEDYIQVYLQKLCVDNIFDTDCGAVLYYSDVKKRVPLSFDYDRESLNELVHDKIKEMRSFIEKGFIPEIKSDQKCDGCSMKDMCMPNSKSGRTVHQMINRMI